MAVRLEMGLVLGLDWLGPGHRGLPRGVVEMKAVKSIIQNNSASAQVLGGTGREPQREQGCVGAALPATTAGSGEFGLEGTERVLVDQVQ
jgi:hypothetical protein